MQHEVSCRNPLYLWPLCTWISLDQHSSNDPWFWKNDRSSTCWSEYLCWIWSEKTLKRPLGLSRATQYQNVPVFYPRSRSSGRDLGICVLTSTFLFFLLEAFHKFRMRLLKLIRINSINNFACQSIGRGVSFPVDENKPIQGQESTGMCSFSSCWTSSVSGLLD